MSELWWKSTSWVLYRFLSALQQNRAQSRLLYLFCDKESNKFPTYSEFTFVLWIIMSQRSHFLNSCFVKHMKVQGRSPSAFIVSRCLEPLIQHSLSFKKYYTINGTRVFQPKRAGKHKRYARLQEEPDMKIGQSLWELWIFKFTYNLHTLSGLSSILYNDKKTG